MQHDERLEDYIFDMDNLCFILNKSDNDRIAYFVRGLKPALKSCVIQKQPISWKDAVQAARLAAISLTTTEQSSHSAQSTSSTTPFASLQLPQHQPSYINPRSHSTFPIHVQPSSSQLSYLKSSYMTPSNQVSFV